MSLIKDLREAIILENDIQNMKYIELSSSGEIIPFEIVEGKLKEAIKVLMNVMEENGNSYGECETIKEIFGKELAE